MQHQIDLLKIFFSLQIRIHRHTTSIHVARKASQQNPTQGNSNDSFLAYYLFRVWVLLEETFKELRAG